MSLLVSADKLTTVFNAWTTAEHARLHGPGNSSMSNLNAMRAASAHAASDYRNTSAHKTSQHIDRMTQRVMALEDSKFKDDITARAVSDCLKLLAGQQIKRMMAVATGQNDFIKRVLESDLGVGFTIQATIDDELADIGNIEAEAKLLRLRLDGAQHLIAERAIGGEDWGREDSPMVTGAWLGEVACARMTIATINHVARHRGGTEYVPLRSPANDAAESDIVFPFAA